MFNTLNIEKMKTKNYLLIVVILIAGIAVSSCKKTESANPASNGTMSLTVDGGSWSASLSVQAVNTNGVINITGSDSGGKQASVVLYNVVAPGTYAVGPNSGNQSNQLRWTQGLGQTDTFVANGILGNGSVTIDELTDSKVSGSFNFTGFADATTSKPISDGQFNANF